MATEYERFRANLCAKLKMMFASKPNVSELARRIGVSRTTMYDWTNGRKLPSADSIAALCRELDISADWLLGVGKK